MPGIRDMVFTGLPSTVLPPYAEALLPCSQKRGEAGLDATAVESVSMVGSDEGAERGESDKSRCLQDIRRVRLEGFEPPTPG